MSLNSVMETIQKILNLLAYGGNFYGIFLLKKEEKKLSLLESFSISDFPEELLDNFVNEIINCECDPENFKKLSTFEKIKDQLNDIEIISKKITTLNGTDFTIVTLTCKKSITDKQKLVFDNSCDLIINELNHFSGNKESAASASSKFERINEVLERIDPVLYSYDVNTSDYFFISGSTEELFGIPSEDIYNYRISFLRSVFPEDYKNFKNFLRKINSGEASEIEYRIKKENDDVKYLRHIGLPVIKDQTVVRIAGIIYDISSEKEFLSNLIKSEEEYNLLMKTAGGLIFILDRSGYFVSINDIGVTLLGYPKKNIIGSHFLEYIDEESKANIAIAFKKILSQNYPVTFEADFIDNFGKRILFEIQAANLKTGNKITGMIGSGRDVTDRKIDEVKLQELNGKLTEANRIISIERDRAKEKISVLEELNHLKNDFISNVSHELRTPLASIVGFAETISTDHDLPRDMVLEFNNIILNEGKRLAKLVNDILDFSKLEEDKNSLVKSKFDLILLTKELVSFYQKYADEKEIIFASEIPESQIIIEADKDRLKTAIGNLINNAVKFTPNGGRVSVIAQEFLNEVEILVSDTGIGISEDKIPQLFQKFSKVGNSQTQGVGFGLATVKQIIDLHKGLIQVKSEVDSGTTFIIRLPKN